MTDWELDHVFIATSEPRSEAVASEFGMTFTERRAHRGQGTSNACALFENAFFELLVAAKPDELDSDVVRPLGLNERIHWQQTRRLSLRNLLPSNGTFARRHQVSGRDVALPTRIRACWVEHPDRDTAPVPLAVSW